MPIYEYSCAKCGKTIEVIQKMSSRPLRTHADCGGKLTKLISQSAFQLKGTGWYVTDYAKKSQGSEESKDTKSDAAKSSASDKGSGGDSKEKPAAASSSSSEKSEKADKTEKPSKPATEGKTKKS